MSEALSILDDMAASGGEPQDLSHQQVPLLRALFEDESGTGLYLFTYHVCGCKDLNPSLHGEICQFLSMWGKTELADGSMIERPPIDSDTVKDSWRRLMLCIFRGSFKTSLATRANTLWRLAKNPEHTFGIFNESESKSKSWVGSIKEVVQCSRLFQVLWKDILPPGIHFEDTRSIPRTWKWGDTGLLFQRDSMNVSELSVEPFGIGGASTGKHFTHKILDDIIGEKSAQSEAVMEDANHWVDYSRSLERPAERGCELWNYTRWAYMDTYAYSLRKWPGEYKVYRRSLLENPTTGEPDVITGVSTFPEQFPTTKAHEMRKKDYYTFSSQYQVIPQSGREVSFNQDWVRYGEVTLVGGNQHFVIDKEHYDSTIVHADVAEERAPQSVPLSWMDLAVILDPAPLKASEKKTRKRAFNGIVMMGKDPWGRLFHLEGVPLREDPMSVLNKVLSMCTYWETNRIAIEEVNFSKVYAPLWTVILRYQHPTFSPRFQALETEGQKKEYRVTSMSGPHRQGLYYYNRPLSAQTVQQLIEYPHGEFRDLVDAMAYADAKVLRRPETPEETMVSFWEESRRDQGRDRWTGY